MKKSNKEIVVKKYKDPGLIDLKMADVIKYKRATRYDFTNIPESEEDDFLELVLKEISLRFDSMCKQAYEIGGLLITIKRVLGKSGKREFGKWIEANLPFCQRTANNFMNVYRVCMGKPELATKFKKSILYKITSDNFPEELREELFANAKGIYEFKDKELASVQQKLINGEIDVDSHEVRNLIRNQKFTQEDERYVVELKGTKKHLTKSLETVKKLNEIGLLEPALPDEDHILDKEYKDIEEMLLEFVTRIEMVIETLQTN